MSGLREPIYARTPIKGVWAVMVKTSSPVTEVLGTVSRHPEFNALWEARNLHMKLVAQRDTRQKAALALIREES